ncbi:glycosyltransferase family 4 protein [Devosia sp. XJ19-1]|uniref:Glycosyltransferase family 4 protein n=1 Tax=Devosia ureilytica TaxID=2952754 RepID=A0A9Q4AM35_9HYPH|nr:glycosyltransferase family 4 protein [Devosia ureilytica]MCP8886200.1 glycosyltransferase family 4 protein [Devosia ureilytica]
MTSALIVSHSGESGGAELFLVDLISAGPRDWQAGFLSGGAAVEALSRRGRPPIVLEAGSRMLSVRRGASLGGLIAATGDVMVAAWRLSKHARGFDVLCANSQKALFVCALAAILARRPLIWLLHDIITDAAFSSINRRAALIFARLFARRIAVNSQETRKALVAAGGQKEKVRLIYNGFDVSSPPDLSPIEIGARLEALGLDPSRPVIGVFARLCEWKGQHVLLHALEELPRVQAIVVGAPLFGEERYEANIHAIAEQLGLQERVRFLGFRDDVPALMSMCDIVVHTSIAAEPFGRVVVEGMLAGRPVVATASGGVTEIIRDGETGLLVPPGDAPALAAAITRLMNDPDMAQRLQAAGRADTAARFSQGATQEAFAALLAELV